MERLNSVKCTSCLRAMRTYVEHRLAARAALLVFVLFAPMLLIPGFAWSLGAWVQSRFPLEAWYALPVLGIGGGVGGLGAAIAGMLRFTAIHHSRTERSFAALRAEARAHPERGRCP